MPINSRAKGAAGEREVANWLKEKGFSQARRGQQHSGIEGQDVVGLEGFHIECKRVEKLNIDNAMEQAIRDAEDGKVPIVIHRKNRKRRLVTMLADDFIELIKED